jgi:hypothetical protein
VPALDRDDANAAHDVGMRNAQMPAAAAMRSMPSGPAI